MKVGIISFAHMHAHSYATHLVNHPDTELAYIWDEDSKRGQEMANHFECEFLSSLDEFLSTDIEAVVICSENANHKEHVVKSARAKKHILCEKPIATEIEDAKEMIRACEEEGVILQIAYPVRFAPGFQKAKELINSGALGEIVAINGTNHGKMPGGWFIEKELSGGGAATDHIVHIMDIIRWVLNDEVKSVYAEIGRRFYDIDVEDCGMVALELESGVIVSIDPSWSRPQTFPTWGDAIINFIGTKGNLQVDAFKQHSVYYNDDAKAISQLPFAEDMDEGLVNDFITSIKEGRSPSITGTDGLRTLEVVKAAYESSEKGQTVLLERQ
ncbi:Gfo/Idh/MocA family oxidoreductase [Bacillus sp. FJAT-49711]|uniref:Gfo/Idh/MocA family protein n=1 Tax=Bacillus sp. FJAT-49711 TaxID=2833585 RepID=UPI001BC9D64F|nr:Gfo/Idh/MocA family oxidoreductase [Bacillus sp. FJAT-49711]MBS4220421.1 Gfo/Idh/MocA family oxidoreductase [Bacillus sp. FJAT-49711]